MSIDDRHPDKNGEISRKHGNALVSPPRRAERSARSRSGFR
jgi:hypothetical protein